MPMIACSVVDLPAPFGPIRPTISPGSTSQREAADGGDAAVAHVEVDELEHRRRSLGRPPGRRSRRGRRRRRRGSPGSPSGVPAASVRALVEHVDAVADVHDQRHVVVDQQDAGVVVVAHASARPRRSRAPRPRAARRRARPSARTTARVASARATPSRRSSPWASDRAGSVLVRLEPSSSSSSSARARASRGLGADAERRDLDVLAHARGRRTSGSAGRCGRARRARGGAGSSR